MIGNVYFLSFRSLDSWGVPARLASTIEWWGIFFINLNSVLKSRSSG
jgi:hypothetical protein